MKGRDKGRGILGGKKKGRREREREKMGRGVGS